MQTTSSNIILDIQNLSCGYGGKPVVEDFTLQVTHGDCIAITGPNGCGKSTLLRAIYQLCVINSGTISYNGHLLNGKTPEQVKKLGIAYFMQKNAVFPKLTVKENLILSLNGMPVGNKKSKLAEMFALFPKIHSWKNKSAGLLSGGQRQQLAMAMLVTQDADLWLLDEPTAGLDNINTEFFISSFQHLTGKTRENLKTIIFVEHNFNAINALATKMLELKIK